MSKRNIRRRAFLQSLGASAAVLPFVPALDTRADPGALVRRLIVFFSSNGTVADAWDPSPNLMLGPILQPLDPYKDRLLFIDGLRMECAHHGDGQAHAPGMNGCLTGTVAIPNGTTGEASEHGLADGISVDQFIAGRLCSQTKFGSLELGIAVDQFGGDALGHLSYAGSRQPVFPENSPTAVFNRVFGNLGPGQSDPGLEQAKTDRRSAIDVVRADLEALRPKLGRDEQAKMDAHLQAIRDIEGAIDTGFGSGANPACMIPAPPVADPGSEFGGTMPAVAKAQIDLMVMAMACDLTRVGSLMVGGPGSGMVYDFLGHKSDHHFHAHNELDPGSRQALIEINNWTAQQFGYLISQLDAIPEGNDTMLDNTVVIWVNELSNGNHNTDPMRIVMSGGRDFTPGRLVQLTGDRYEYNNLLVSLCHAMGMTDVTTFGDPRFCSGPLGALV